jgi:hypothetical protein
LIENTVEEGKTTIGSDFTTDTSWKRAWDIVCFSWVNAKRLRIGLRRFGNIETG